MGFLTPDWQALARFVGQDLGGVQVWQVLAFAVLLLWLALDGWRGRAFLFRRQRILDRVGRRGSPAVLEPHDEGGFPWLASAVGYLNSTAEDAGRDGLAEELELELAEGSTALASWDEWLPRLILICTSVHLLVGLRGHESTWAAVVFPLLVTNLGLLILYLGNGWLLVRQQKQAAALRARGMRWFEVQANDRRLPPPVINVTTSSGHSGAIAEALREVLREFVEQQVRAGGDLRAQVAELTRVVGQVAASQQALAQSQQQLAPLASLPGEIQALRESSGHLTEVARSALENNAQLAQQTRQEQEAFQQTLTAFRATAEEFAACVRQHRADLQETARTQQTYQAVGDELRDSVAALRGQVETVARSLNEVQTALRGTAESVGQSGTAIQKVLGDLGGTVQRQVAAAGQGLESALARLDSFGAALDERLGGLEEGIERFTAAAARLEPAAQAQTEAAQVFRAAAMAFQGNVGQLQAGSAAVAEAGRELRTTAGTLASAVGTVQTALEEAGRTVGTLSATTGRFEKAATSLAAGTQRLDQTLTEVQAAAGTIARVVGDLTRGLTGLLKEFHAQGLEPAAESLARLQELFEHLRRDLDLSGALQDFRNAVGLLSEAANTQYDAARDLRPRGWLEWIFGSRRRRPVEPREETAE